MYRTRTYTVTTPAPAPPPGNSLVGTHFPDPDNMTSDLNNIGAANLDFAITNVAPGDTGEAASRIDTAVAAGFKVAIGLYAFGGPEPYALDRSTHVWTFSADAITTIQYFATRDSDIAFMFGLNEPLFFDPSGNTYTDGWASAEDLRQFRAKVRTYWPTATIWHDLGLLSEWMPGGDLWNTYPAIGNKYANVSGICDYYGMFSYPFVNPADYSGGYAAYKNSPGGLPSVSTEGGVAVNSIGCSLGMLLQTFADPADSTRRIYPTSSDLFDDWIPSVRAVAPANTTYSYYPWTEQAAYTDALRNHPEQWSRLKF